MAENRRVRMTKRMMKNALLELLEQKSPERITVTEVCARADVNRSTFYAYYTDVEGLLREIEDDMIAQLPLSPENISGFSDARFLALLEEFFSYVQANERQFRILLILRDRSSFHLRLLNVVMEKYRVPLESGNRFPDRYAYQFCLSGVIGLMKEWIEDGFPFSAREFAGIALELCVRTTQ